MSSPKINYREVYELAKANDPRSIKPMMDMLTEAALEILKLEAAVSRTCLDVEKEAKNFRSFVRRWKAYVPAPPDESLRFQKRSLAKEQKIDCRKVQIM